MKRFRFFLALSLFLTSGLAADRRPDASKLVIMTFNAEFLWDGVPPEEGTADFPWRDSETEAEEHMQKVADVIIHYNPDIINLVEVENIESLDHFNEKFLPGRGYAAHLIKGKDNSTGQDVCILTRIDLDEALVRDDRDGLSGSFRKSVSKNYIAKVSANGRRLGFVGLHLLAFPNDLRRKQQREAQADAIRGMAQDLVREGVLPIVLGDFNDYESLEQAADHQTNTPITSVLRQIRELDPANSGDDLANVAAFVPQSERYTAFWDANRNGSVDAPHEFSAIDHILTQR